MIKFKTRETTECIRLHFDNSMDKLTNEEIKLKQLKKGKLNLGYHYILRKNGDLVEGIDDRYFADYELDGYKTSIYVLVTADKLTDAQKITLKTLKDKLDLPIRYKL